jgi:RNA recognition motif-containing protein
VRRSSKEAPEAVGLDDDRCVATTLMIRNLPNRLSPQALMEHIATLGFQGTYDYVYMPQDKKTGSNKGYAFVNFMDCKDARIFIGSIEQSSWTSKRVAVTPARCQGVLRNLEQMVSLGLDANDGPAFSMPWILVDGEMTALPCPTAYDIYSKRHKA